MGATDFIDVGRGPTVEEAYESAVKQAHYDYGHSGYSGTIAEKSGWVIIDSTKRTYQEAVDTANQLLADDDPRISDKWGPAGAIALDNGNWLFFGWASC